MSSCTFNNVWLLHSTCKKKYTLKRLPIIHVLWIESEAKPQTNKQTNNNNNNKKRKKKREKKRKRKLMLSAQERPICVFKGDNYGKDWIDAQR